MLKFVFLINDHGYNKYIYTAAVEGGASAPHIGKWEKLFELHNAEPLNRYFELPFKRIWFHAVVDESKLQKEDEIVFVLYESFHMSYSRKFITHYKKKYRNSKFIYIFSNPAGAYNRRRIETIKDLLDAIFTFNQEDAVKYGYMLLGAAPFSLPPQGPCEIESDVFFIGSDKGRLSLLLAIFEKLSSKGLVCDFWITEVSAEKQRYADKIHYNQRMTYEEVLQRDAKTRCIIEVLQDGKSYSSIRTTEALFYHKKLLTTSVTTKECWFYDPDIIQVFSSADDIDTDFVRKPVDEAKYDGLISDSYSQFKEFVVDALSKKNG